MRLHEDRQGIAFLLAGLLLVGCGAEGDDGPAPSLTASATATVSASSTLPASATPAATALLAGGGSPTVVGTMSATATPEAIPTTPVTTVVAPTPTRVPEPPSPTTAPAFPAQATIEMLATTARFIFRPAYVEIAAGGSITFVWVGNDPHNVVSTGPPSFVDQPAVATGGTFTVVFTQPGTYTFICEIHPDSMKGSVTVH